MNRSLNWNQRIATLALNFLMLGVLPSGCAEPQVSSAEVSVNHVPEVVHTTVQGVTFRDLQSVPKDAQADSQNLTWLFHLVFHSHSSRHLSFQAVEITFLKEGKD